MQRRERATREGDEVARPEDWIGLTVVMGTDMHGDDTVGTLEEANDRGVVVRHGIVEVESEVVEFEADPEGEVVEIEAELEGEPQRQSIFYPWSKVNWMYHPEE
jgi:translation initiation factor 6 (eIF-6)